MQKNDQTVSANSVIQAFVDHPKVGHMAVGRTDSWTSKEHQAAEALLALRSQPTVDAPQHVENFEAHRTALALMALHKQAVAESQQPQDLTEVTATAMPGARTPARGPYRLDMPKTSALGAKKPRRVYGYWSESSDSDQDVVMAEDESAGPRPEKLKQSNGRFLLEGDTPIDGFNMQGADPAESADSTMTDVNSSSDETEIIVTGATPPTSPYSNGGQSVQPAATSPLSQVQRMRQGLLTWDDPEYDQAEPLEQWQILSQMMPGKVHSWEEVEEQRRQGLLPRPQRDTGSSERESNDWEVQYALTDPITELPMENEESEYEEKTKGKRSRKGAKRGRKVKLES